MIKFIHKAHDKGHDTRHDKGHDKGYDKGYDKGHDTCRSKHQLTIESSMVLRKFAFYFRNSFGVFVVAGNNQSKLKSEKL